MASRAEQETQILANQADLAEGYFWFNTTYLPHYRKLAKRIGKANFISERPITENGAIVGYEVKLARRYLSLTTFGLKTSGNRGSFKARKRS